MSAMNHRHTVADAGKDAGRPRAPLGVRIALVVVAVLALCLASLSGLNLIAAVRFNQATATLNANLATARKSDADLDALRASQQQVDAQFAQAGSFGFLLLPSIRQSIATNAQASRQASTRIRTRIAEQKGLTQDKQATTSTDGGNGSDADGAKASGTLSEAQKKQVEELLKANQQSTPADSSGQGGDTGKDTTTAKPW